jgi:RNA polymerase-binding transcription factor DksA
MSRLDEREIEAVAAMVEMERDAGIARARAALETAPADHCVDCRDPIDAARRAAMPLARRCVRCQAIRDHAMRRANSCS